MVAARQGRLLPGTRCAAVTAVASQMASTGRLRHCLCCCRCGWYHSLRRHYHDAAHNLSDVILASMHRNTDYSTGVWAASCMIMRMRLS